MDRRIRLTALMLAASLLLNMVVLPVHGQEDTAPSAAQVSQENEPTEVPTETVPAPPQTTVPSTTVETQAPTVPEETTQAAETTETTAQTEPTQATQETTEPAETEPGLSLLAEPEIPEKNGNTYRINSLAQLVGLSTLPASDYANSNVEIVFKSGDVSSVADQFLGLGSSSAPFAGNLIFNGDAEASLTLSRPLFNYLSSQATCTVNNSANGGYLQLTDNNGEGALLAKVLTGGGTGSEWKIAVYNSRAEDVQPYSVPIIGGMETGSAMTLSVKDGYWYPVQTENAGLLCGSMGENAQLTLEHYEQITAKETEYFVMATSGAAGGLVGKMGKGAALTVKPDLSFPEKTIQAAGGAGDLVGEMGENATLTVSGSLTCAGKIDAGGTGGSLVGQMGKNARVTVTGNLALNVTEVTAGGSAGGLVGRMAEGSVLTLPETEELTVQTNLSGSNVGGLVGEMKDGAGLSGLSGTAKVTVSGTVTATQNAGGLIGLGENLALDGGMPEVTATKITGSSTAGGLIGSYTYSKTGDYYNGSTDYPSVNVNLSDSNGNVGGLYGYVKNTAGDFCLKGEKTVTVTAAKGNSLGGLMGRYEANSLTAQSLTVNTGEVSLSGNGNDSYGGLIGSVYGSGGVYIEVQKAAPTCTANNNAANNVGGLIGKLDGGGHMLRLSGVTASGLPGNSASGGLVGYMQKGVLYLGKDITIHQPGSGGKNGWVLGDRDNTLVYTDQSWNPKKGTTNDIGGWGQVVRSNNLPGLLTYDSAERTVTVAAPNGSEGTYTVGSAAEFAALALRYQLNETNSLKFDGGDIQNGAAQTVNLTADVNDLENIGITGFQRDVNNASKISVTLNGNGHTVTLPDIPVYTGGTNHDRQGLFTKTTNLTASNLTLKGSITAYADAALYIGALCAETEGRAALTQVTGGATTLLDATEAQTYNLWGCRVSGLLATAKEADFTDCRWTGKIIDSTKSQCYLGGFCAKCEGEAKITTTNCTLSGTIDKADAGWSDAAVGGLVASMGGYNQTMTIDGLTVDGLKITTGSNSASGGLLGYEWPNTRATITGVSVKNSTLNAGTNARFGGLVYTGSGYWRVEKGTAAEPYGIHFVSGNAFTGKSEQNAPSGLIVAKGEKNGNAALYLEIREDAYKAEGTTVNIGGSQYFDEIVGSNQSANNNGIVSIALPGHAPIDRTGCNTYRSQLGGTWVNGKTRYYYNLDAYRDALGANAETGAIGDSPNLGAVDTAPKLMLWNAYHDSENGLRKYFSAQTGGFVISKEIDLGGYSFYPTPFINDTTIQNASITFDYDTMNDLETGANNKPLGQSNSQHYQMHTGIFSGGKATDKDQSLNVDGLKLSGTVGRSATGTGALCCGPFSGSSIYARMYLTIQNVDLAGIRVSSGSAEKPLLIYSLGSYSTLDMNGVETSTGYEDLNTDKYAASSLIGRVGGTTGKEIRLTFKKMCLDGRPGRNNAVQYGTTGCIFSRALFLESFDYVEASSGVYNFTEAEKDACTLGRELSNSTTGNIHGRNNDEQRWYYGGKLEDKLVSGSADGWNSFYQDYQRYVNQPENLTVGSTQHELDVNLNTAGLEIGCGTRTDPYILTEFSQLKTLNLVLRDGAAENWPVNLDPEVLANVQKKQSFADTDEHTRYNVNGGHVSYTYSPDSGKWVGENGTSVEPAVMRLYLQNAHYQLEKDITADNSWDGLGHADSTGQTGSQIIAFGGEIDGGGHTFTIPGSTASQFGGLVKYSMGSVVRNITIEYTGSISLSCTEPPSSEISPAFFGGVVGYAFGGDTILDGVSVSIANPPETKDSHSYLAAVGGYVGLVGGAFSGASHSGKNKYGGGVVFRGQIGSGLTGGKASETSGQFYYNPYVGRVLDGYVLGDGVSLENTNKNYQIPNISSEASVNSHLEISQSGKNITATVKDAEGLWLLSAIANSGAAAMNGYEAYSFSRPRIGSYAMTSAAARKDDTCLGGVSLTAKNASQCYLSKYVSEDFSKLATSPGLLITIQFTADCDMTGYGNGFRGIGGSYVCINVGTPNDYTRQLHIQTVDGKKSDGNRAVITLNQQRNEYVTEKNKWTVSGSGLFLAVRNATDSTFSNLILSGKTGITYFDKSGNPCQAGDILDNSNTLWDQSKRANMAAAGMLISSFCAHRTNAVILKGVTLRDASVNGDSLGCTTAGGFIGMIGFNTQFKNEARFIDCTYENLTVRALIMAGGFAGYSGATKVTVSNTKDVELTDGDIRATAPFCMIVENSSRQDAGGLFGHIHRYDDSTGTLEINPAESDAVMTIRNLKVTGTVTGTNDTTVGGLVGYENVAKRQTVTVKGVRLEGKVELVGAENTNAKTNVGGLFGFLSDAKTTHWRGTSDAVYHLSVLDVTIGRESGSAVRMANGRQLGGLIGLMKNPGGLMTIDQVSVGSESGTVQILAGSSGSSDCITGGLLGVVCLYPSMTLSNIRLNHTATIGKRASGGAVGQVENQSWSTDAAYVPKIQLENLSVENSDIAACNSRSSVGGLYGYLSGCTANLTGTNILLKDNRIGYLLNDSQNGYRGNVPNEWTGTLPIGLVNGKSENTGIFGGQRSPWSGHSYTLKFTGVSLVQAENTVPTQDFGTALAEGDYLVRSDYTGIQEETALSAYPHVTTNPISPLTALLGQNVTGDGACFDGATPIGEKIRFDSGGTENRNLTHTAVEEARKYLTDTETNRPSDMAYFGSFTGDGDNGDYSGGNFPVFVISTTSTDEANRALYSALSLLTNRVMYGKTITNDLDPAPPADMKLSLTNYVYSGGQWQASQEDGSFTLNETTKRIRLNGQYDNQRARFTLLRAEFANPADASQTAYTLYLPILVKKVFNFRFWASALTGTSYIQSNYDDLNRLAIASDNEKVTALLGFDYTRTREEWQKAVNDGENLLWNFLKQLRLNVRLPDDTRLVLVDRNNQDKAWYATASQALQQVDSYYELKFTSFQDQTGTRWTPVTLSQLLPLTARTLTDAEKADETLTGKFVITADKTQAMVQIGDTYYRKATDEDKNQTQYAISVGEWNGELSERYYLTLQTPANSQQLLNILLTCDDRLTNPAGNGLPTKRLPASETNPNNGFARNADENRIVIASCFSQTVSLTTAESQLERISDSNTQVKAGLTATIRFKDAESAKQFQNYAGDQSLSQCFNLVFYRYEGNTRTQVNLTPGTQITAVYRYGEKTWTEHYIVDTATRSYRLTFPAQIPCGHIQAHAVELTAELTLDFASSYVDQFPTRESENDGILMAVTSTLSYTPQTLTSSTLSTQPPSEDTLHRHFYRGEVSVASLNYDAVGDTEMDSINQLGINGFEGDSQELLSAASYNVSAVSKAENARYLRCTLTLSPRNNTGTQPFVSYGAAVPWNKCLTGEKMKLSLRYTGSETGQVIQAANPTNTEDNVNATYTATFRLDNVLDKNVPLEISADMFLLAGAALEDNGMTYANYKIRLEAELLDENQNAISGSNASDYLVYTNSRIYKNIIPRT